MPLCLGEPHDPVVTLQSQDRALNQAQGSHSLKNLLANGKMGCLGFSPRLQVSVSHQTSSLFALDNTVLPTFVAKCPVVLLVSHQGY